MAVLGDDVTAWLPQLVEGTASPARVDIQGQQTANGNSLEHYGKGRTPSQPADLDTGIPRKRKRNADSDAIPSGSASSFELSPDHSHGVYECPRGSSRTPGLHSTTALFRQPSEASKQYARPPMARIFASLEISSENFLRLQGAAKAYMLDDNHPERRASVGQKGKGDATMVKLNLLRCVEEFLDNQGWGETVFGVDAFNKGFENRQHIWPRDRDRIIQLITPLLRRMVTNERQRLYARETRSAVAEDPKVKAQSSVSGSGSEPEPASRTQTLSFDQNLNCDAPTASSTSSVQPAQPVTPLLSSSQTQYSQLHRFRVDDWLNQDFKDLFLHDMMPSIPEAEAYYNEYNNQNDQRLDGLQTDTTLTDPEWFNIIAAIDSHIRLFHTRGHSCPPACEEAHLNLLMARWDPLNPEKKTQAEIDQSMDSIRDAWDIIRRTNANMDPIVTQAPYGSSVNMSIYVHFNKRRIMPRIELPARDYLDLQIFKSKVKEVFDEDFHDSKIEVIVWLHTGLSTVHDDAAWKTALEHAEAIPWMEKELKVLIELNRADDH